MILDNKKCIQVFFLIIVFTHFFFLYILLKKERNISIKLKIKVLVEYLTFKNTIFYFYFLY